MTADNDNPAPLPQPLDLDAHGYYDLPLCLADLRLLLGQDIAAIEATTLEGAVVRLPFPLSGLKVLGHLIAAALAEQRDETEVPLS